MAGGMVKVELFKAGATAVTHTCIHIHTDCNQRSMIATMITTTQYYTIQWATSTIRYNGPPVLYDTMGHQYYTIQWASGISIACLQKMWQLPLVVASSLHGEMSSVVATMYVLIL
jgi:hypothetical protein